MGNKGILPAEIPGAIRVIAALISYCSPLTGRAFTVPVKVATSYWSHGGPYLLYYLLRQAQEQNPFYAESLARVLILQEKPDREYASVLFVPVRSGNTALAEFLETTATDTRNERFQDLIKMDTPAPDPVEP